MFDLRATRLRSSPRFRLISFDQVDDKERRLLEPMAADAGFYGLLAPPANSSLPVKSVSRDAALLFLTLREPACVPHLLSSLFGADVQNRVRELVLDGVFEIEQGGRFVSGLAAFPEIVSTETAVQRSRVAQLSTDAIAYAGALEELELAEIAARLYMYNRAPVVPRFLRQFADDEKILEYLIAGTVTDRALQSHWKRQNSSQGWLFWQGEGRAGPHPFKLYVSPAVEALPQAFQIAVDSFARVKCTQFKVGRSAYGLLRPDKLVAYFVDLDQLREAAELIHASAAGITTQGVPFTAAIDREGLVSWGMDPPRLEQVLADQTHQSWRQWVAARIAVYTMAAKESGAEDLVGFVLERVGLDGIDTSTWSPNLAIWRGLAETEEVA